MKKILLIGNANSNSSSRIFQNLIIDLIQQNRNITVISGNKPHKNNVEWISVSELSDIFIINFIFIQLKIMKYILKSYHNYNDIVILIEHFVFINILCRILNIKNIIFVDGKSVNTFSSTFSKISFHYASKLIVPATSLIKDWKIEKFKPKIFLSKYYIDINKFYIKKDYKNRNKNIGFIGRFTEEKRLSLFLEFCSLVINIDPKIKIYIAGDGRLKKDLIYNIQKYNMENKVRLCGWIEDNKLADFYNELRLLIITSKVEGGPLVALESMSCGTPILSTKVGIIEDVIVDGINGYIFNEENIMNQAIKVVKLLNSEELNTVSVNARNTIVNNYSYESGIQDMNKIL
ncbi:MAG: glycosyltransferase family 4 protein [Methanomassiliicoccales archaeon]|nr:MAG: glycosyltransferase family 4 protein [Methanomassiliicoccales archaeon]